MLTDQAARAGGDASIDIHCDHECAATAEEIERSVERHRAELERAQQGAIASQGEPETKKADAERVPHKRANVPAGQ